MGTSARWLALEAGMLLFLVGLACRGFHFQWSFTVAPTEIAGPLVTEATPPAAGPAEGPAGFAVATSTPGPAPWASLAPRHGNGVAAPPTAPPTTSSSGMPIQVQASVPQVFFGAQCGPAEPTVVHIQAQVAPTVPGNEVILYFGYGQQAVAPPVLQQALTMFPVGEGRYQAEVDVGMDAPVLLDAPHLYDALYYQVMALDGNGNEAAASSVYMLPLRLCGGS